MCVIEYGKDENYIVGHTAGYTQVLLPRDPALLGCQVVARILSAEKWCVKGQVVRVVEHAVPLPPVSISRPNVLPTPQELQATSLTVVQEAPAVPARPGGAVEEDYGEEEEEAQARRGAGAQESAHKGAAGREEALRKRPGRALRSEAPPASATGAAAAHDAAGEGAEQRKEAGWALARFSAVALPMVLILCFVEPVITSLAALVGAWLFVQRHRQLPRNAHTTLGSARGSAGVDLAAVPPALGKGTAAVVTRSVPPAKTSRLASPSPSASSPAGEGEPPGQEGERKLWEATRTTWVSGDGDSAGVPCGDVPGGDGCCGGGCASNGCGDNGDGDSGVGVASACATSGAGAGAGGELDRGAESTALSCCSAGTGTAAGGCCMTESRECEVKGGGAGAVAEGEASHPEWRKGQLT